MNLLERLKTTLPCGKRRYRRRMHPQSIMFPKATWTELRAKAWAKRNGYLYGKVDSSGDFYKIRQADPEQFTEFATITLDGTDIEMRLGR